MTQDAEKIWDVVVVGGGASGMMAAATAAARGASVCLLEKNNRLGKKLRITGGGRCNVTNNKRDTRQMLAQYKGRGKFLFSTFAQHGVGDTVSWFTDRGVELKEENVGRMFPITDSAETICATLEKELDQHDVQRMRNTEVSKIEKRADGMFIVRTNNNTYFAKHCILATGGLSRPDTGSTGDGFTFAEQLGHTVIAHDVALVPIATKETWVRDVSGITVDEVQLTIQVDKERGRILFTHRGVSGPMILNASKEINDYLQGGTVTLNIDLFPEDDLGSLRSALTSLFHKHSNRKLRNVISELLPAALGRKILRITSIDADTPCHSVSVADKKELCEILKNRNLTVDGLMGTDKAVISSGGVKLEEINFKTMESKIVSGLYVVGDMLDIDRPSGGYSLQLCWSTGFVAGVHAST